MLTFQEVAYTKPAGLFDGATLPWNATEQRDFKMLEMFLAGRPEADA